MNSTNDSCYATCYAMPLFLAGRLVAQLAAHPAQRLHHLCVFVVAIDALRILTPLPLILCRNHRFR
eukprot:766682-Hanusia_phi.AAC.1